MGNYYKSRNNNKLDTCIFGKLYNEIYRMVRKVNSGGDSGGKMLKEYTTASCSQVTIAICRVEEPTIAV